MKLGLIPAAIAAILLAIAPMAQAATVDRTIARAPGARPAVGSVEEGMWALMDKAERDARAKADRNGDSDLNAYVRGVACKVAAEYCSDIRVYVMDRPGFNAHMAPNGYSEIWGGTLLRLEDEAQLAFILSHEVSHFEQNHSLEAWQAEKTRQDIALAVSIGVAVVGVAAAANANSYQLAQDIMDLAGNIIDLTYLIALQNYFRYSRAHETEADTLGYARLVKAGYRPTGALTVWEASMAENAASDFERIRKSGFRNNIFGTHPLDRERMANLTRLLPTGAASGDDGRIRYREAIRPFLGAWLRDDLRRRDYGQTLSILDRLDNHGEDLGVVSFFRGEVHRLRRRDGDAALAEAAYALATGQPDAPVAAWRELGDLRRKRGDAAGARQAFQTYLDKAPQAEDAWIVQDSLNSLGGA